MSKSQTPLVADPARGAGPPPAPTEPPLLATPSEHPDNDAQPAAVGEVKETHSRFAVLRRFTGRFTDSFLPARLQRAGMDIRRRARFVVLTALAIAPFYGVLAQQLWSSGLHTQAAVAAAFGMVVLACPFLLRVTRSHVLPGTLVCLLNTLIVFIQAYADAGLSDPILYWSALVPLAAALSVGPWLSLTCALLNVAGIGLLYGLTLRGYVFPHASSQSSLDLAAFVSVVTASAFACLWGWLYEGQTLRELRLLNSRLRQSRTDLSRSEAHFRSLLENASDVTAELDGRGTLTYLSPSVRRVLGYDPEMLRGQTPFELIHPDDRRRVRAFFAVFRRARRRGSADLGSIECRIRHADGHDVYIESAAMNRLTDAGAGGIVLNARDVTERKRAETILVHAKEQAEAVARLKSTFLANMSHEIRTPLTGILGFASILAEEVADPQQQEFVALIEKSGHRLMDTLNSVLDLARIEAGRMELALAPYALADAAEECVRLMQPMAQERGLQLEARVLAPGTEARVDAGALHRILTNLVGNALKFTKEGTVTVEVDAAGAEAVLRVCDTGIGIAEGFLPRLFDEFEQESTGIGRSHEGSGLGLAITRELVERMGGRIGVESQKGVGSVFTVTFPRAAEAARAAVKPARAAPAMRGRRLLVVEDNADTRRLLRRMLRDGADGFAVDTVSTAAETLSAATRVLYDAVLLDVNLSGGVSGEHVVPWLRALAGYADVPLIAFTAYALVGDRERFLRAGFDGYLAKPFTKPQLLDTLNALLDGPPAPPEEEPATAEATR